jgi:hypothetical protein
MPKDEERWKEFRIFRDIQGPPRPELPVWLDRLCKIFFGILAFGMVFLICGGLLWVLPYLGTKWISRRFLWWEESWVAWGRFILGGIIGVGYAFRRLMR